MRVPRHHVTSRVAASGAVLLLALAGCAGDDSSESPAADTKGDVETSAPASASPEPEGPLDERTLLPAMRGAIEEETSVHLVMDVGGGAQSMTAEGDFAFQGEESDLAMTMQGPALGGNVVDVRMLDGTMYVSLPPMTPAGKFVRILPGDRSSPMAEMVEQMQVDPRDTFDAFEAGLRTVTYVGEESVAGEELDRYRLGVDLEAAAKARGMDLPPASAGIPETVEYDIWLDDDALMRKVTAVIAGQEVVMTMSDWGKPVTVEAPPPRLLVRP